MGKCWHSPELLADLPAALNLDLSGAASHGAKKMAVVRISVEGRSETLTKMHLRQASWCLVGLVRVPKKGPALTASNKYEFSVPQASTGPLVRSVSIDWQMSARWHQS